MSGAVTNDQACTIGKVGQPTAKWPNVYAQPRTDKGSMASANGALAFSWNSSLGFPVHPRLAEDTVWKHESDLLRSALDPARHPSLAGGPTAFGRVKPQRAVRSG